MSKCLIVEDDPCIAAVLRHAVEEKFFSAADVACDGEQGLRLGAKPDYRLIILDLRLPKISGFTILRQLRAAGVTVPILILSCCDKVSDRVEALRIGADDYVNKPFHLEELHARIRALLRRPAMQKLKFCLGDLEMDCVERTVTRAGKYLELQQKEFTVLEYLMRNVGHVVTREMLLEHVWGGDNDVMASVVGVYISLLRRKIDAGYDKKLIHNIRGMGYVMMDPDETLPAS